jgi:endothelin-converting enzyme/putative endopeptidase
MRNILFVLCLVAVLSCFAFSQAAMPDASTPSLERFNPDQVDKSLDPCTDFFQYACRKWNSAHPIPSDQGSWGTFNSLAIWNIAAVHDTLEDAANAKNRTAVQQRVGDYYASCMDEATINRLGITPLNPMLDRISKLKKTSELPALLADLQLNVRPGDLVFTDNQYNGVVFGIYQQPDFDQARTTLAALDQAGMGMPGRDFYLNDDEKSKDIRQKYEKHIARLLTLSGESDSQASADAKNILAMETAFAKASMDIIARRDPKNQNNKMSLKQVQELTPSFQWTTYLDGMHAPTTGPFLVLAPEYFRGMEQLIKSAPVEQWRAYLRYSVINHMASSLSQPFVDENFDFYRRTLGGAQQDQPRWRRCSFYADFDLGEDVGQAYVAKYFSPESKAKMLQMVKAIEASLNQDISDATWMSDATRKSAHVKLAAQIEKIGYPDKWRDYSTVEIKRDDFVGNIQRAARYENLRRMSKMNKPTDRYDWNMTPPTVNAYEDAPTNTINFPAGILQPPFFDPNAPDAMNYGGIGMVIGHEIIHGFDDQGRKFDADGNLKDWWTADDAKNYDQRDKCIQDEYTQDVPEAGVKQNGALSAGEDTADNGGIHIALAALESTLQSQGKTLDSKAIGDLTEAQLFFLSFANIWCGEVRPEMARTQVMTQGHSLNRYRVNNVLANLPQFDQAFSCHSGQAMVHANQCRVW